jgi:hypothetical protein
MDGARLQNQGLSLKRWHVRSWWVLVFCTLSVAFYFQAAHSRTTAISELSDRLEELENTKRLAADQQEELDLCLQSESDPAWIEMVLMKELGVVPDRWVKVHFQK